MKRVLAPKSLAAAAAKAVKDLRTQREKCQDPQEIARLDELIKLAGGTGEPIVDETERQVKTAMRREIRDVTTAAARAYAR